jgi:hypothetical protein
MEPTVFRPAAGQLVWISHFVGQKFKGDAVPRDPDRVARFFDRGPNGDADVPGFADPAMPAGFLKSGDAGLHWIGYESNTTAVELDPATFARYVDEEGLDAIAAERKAHGDEDKGVHELFSRCAKLAIEVGEHGPHPKVGGALGLTLEIIPQRDVLKLRAADPLPLTVLFHGQPLGHALVTAREKGQPENRLEARTDSKGRVTLHLDHPGVWLIKVTEMEHADPTSGADWRSYWASLTFELRS